MKTAAESDMPDNTPAAPGRSALLTSEDWWAVWLGGLIAAVAAAGLLTAERIRHA